MDGNQIQSPLIFAGMRLATLKGHENDPRIQPLNRRLVDPEVREFINETYQGAVVPVF